MHAPMATASSGLSLSFIFALENYSESHYFKYGTFEEPPISKISSISSGAHAESSSALLIGFSSFSVIKGYIICSLSCSRVSKKLRSCPGARFLTSIVNSSTSDSAFLALSHSRVRIF